MPAPSLHELGPYELRGTLGAGGMGVVYRAWHRELGVERAVKVLARPDNPRSLRRFQREIEALAAVRHPGVVTVHDVGVAGRQLYYGMNLLEGEPLDAVLSRGRLPLETALEIATRLADGTAALHHAGIVHRDLKPANVVLAGDRPVILDLGLAYLLRSEERLTKSGAVTGSVLYMPPEQALGGKITPRTDVCALGLILFELVTGSPPLSGAGVQGRFALVDEHRYLA